MKPMIIIPPKTMSAEDIAELRKNEICVVVAKNPATVKFVDPIPSISQRSEIEDAAIRLSRILMSGRWAAWTNANYVHRGDIARMYVDILVKGTALDELGSLEEQREQAYNYEKMEESRRLARADAKAEREAKKKADAEAKAKGTK